MRNNVYALAGGLSGRYRRLLVIGMLVCLHVAAVLGVEDTWARGMMVAHLGLFILWQPFMHGARRLKPGEVLLVAAGTIGLLLFLNWWILGLWVALLAGIVGGKVFLFQTRWLRLFYLTIFLYVVALLLLWIVPNEFPATALESEVQRMAQFGLPVLFVLMAFLPAESESSEPQVVDFLYTALIFLLLVALALGSFTFMTVAKVSYGIALTSSLLGIGLVLLFLSLAWNPRAGFSGLSVFFSRYLLSIGLPFEQWLHFLAELARVEARPEQFLRQACAGLEQLPWVTGGRWETGLVTGEFGTPSKHTVEYTGREMSIRLYSRHRPSPSLVWHFNLLGQLVGQFYVAKQRELKLQQQTYVQALHETGARMTHDVKNLLQSLNVLCAAAERDQGTDPAALQALIRRHLPTVTQRLQHTLDKLQRPQMETGRFIQASAWWEGLQRAYYLRGVSFQSGMIEPGVLLPKDLFDGAADNLIQNALEKRKLDAAVVVRVSFDCSGYVVLAVCDSGRPVAPEVVPGLLKGPVPSETGYGIGLYQVARHAEVSGYSLNLVSNDPGGVCFELRGEVRRGGQTKPVEPSVASTRAA